MHLKSPPTEATEMTDVLFIWAVMITTQASKHHIIELKYILLIKYRPIKLKKIFTTNCMGLLYLALPR